VDDDEDHIFQRPCLEDLTQTFHSKGKNIPQQSQYFPHHTHRTQHTASHKTHQRHEGGDFDVVVGPELDSSVGHGLPGRRAQGHLPQPLLDAKHLCVRKCVSVGVRAGVRVNIWWCELTCGTVSKVVKVQNIIETKQPMKNKSWKMDQTSKQINNSNNNRNRTYLV